MPNNSNTNTDLIIRSKSFSKLNESIKLNYRDIFINLGKLAFSLGTGDTKTSLHSILGLLKDIKLKEDSPEECAWLLISQALVQALNNTVKEYKDFFSLENDTNLDLEKLSDIITDNLENIEVSIDLNFFKSPANLTILSDFEKTLKKFWLQPKFGFSSITADAFCYWLKDEFIRNLHYFWAISPEKYEALKERLETPFAVIESNQKKWYLYNNDLCYLANERVFNEEFILKKIYVKLNAYYKNPEFNKNDTNPTKPRIAINLEQYIDHWLQNFDKDKALILISGGPGYGKSSYCKILVSETAQNYKKLGINILFVPLYHLDYENNLESSITNFLRYNKHKINNPLDPKTGKKRLLLVFDGLDELSPPSNSTPNEVAKNFITTVRNTLFRINSSNGDYKVQALITGRESIIQSNILYIEKDQFLHLLPYCLKEEEIEKYKSAELLEKDLRELWWQNYSNIKKLEDRNLPEKLKKPDYFDITRVPLLNCLIALQFIKNNDITHNRNLIYQELLDEVYKKKWRATPNSNIEPAGYILILEQIALTIWQKETKIISLKEIRDTCPNIDIDIITSFYFRRISDTDYEFTHKTFSEYLTAKAIVHSIKEITKKSNEHMENSDNGLAERDALEEWRKIYGSNMIGVEIYNFIRDEIETYSEEDVKKWQKIFFDLLLSAINLSMPMEKSGITKYSEMKKQARNTEESLLAIHAACHLKTKKRTPHTWEDNDSNFKDFWQRIHSDKEKKPLTSKILIGLELSSCNLEMLNFSNTKLQNMDLKETNINNANCTNANFVDVNLYGSKFNDSNLHNATFSGKETSLRNCEFNRANLSKILFDEGTDLTGAKFIEANCTKSKLTGTILKNADFNKSNLYKACLVNAELTNTSFKEANLSEANFKDAILIDTNFEKANLRKADFSGATLKNTNFSGADIREAIFNTEDIDEKTRKGLEELFNKGHTQRSD